MRDAHSGIAGIYGRPWIDLSPWVDTAAFPDLHEEITLGLAQVPLDMTGGSHRSMGIMPPGREGEALVDYQEVIRDLTDAQFEVFRSLADRPANFDPASRGTVEYGEERAVPLSRRQMNWLKIRFGVYFPWKGYVELIPNRSWGDKTDPAGKEFTRAARTFFPKTIAFVRSLPFAGIGRCNIMGLEAFDYGTVHRDGDPREQEAPDPFVTFCPGGGKRLFLWDDVEKREIFVDSPVYWFNDNDYHGVAADPYFRYSVRVDGPFLPEFLENMKGQLGL